MPRRLALGIALLACLAPSAWRLLPPARAPSCEPEGRGQAPGHWIGCRGDPGPVRELVGLELIHLGRPVDLNRATAEDLAGVPGIGPGLAGEVVREREERGPFASPEGLRRVRGIGPARLDRARPWVRVSPP
ncbi:MAG: helix-hairpin-helix domain-containing protein [Anaeromyxobacteraceae bacterium]